MSDPNRQPEMSPLLQQTMNKFFHLPWPRKPLNKAPGKSGKSSSRGVRSGSHRKAVSSLY